MRRTALVNGAVLFELGGEGGGLSEPGFEGFEGLKECAARPPRASPARIASLARAPDCGLLGFAKGAGLKPNFMGFRNLL